MKWKYKFQPKDCVCLFAPIKTTQKLDSLSLNKQTTLLLVIYLFKLLQFKLFKFSTKKNEI